MLATVIFGGTRHIPLLHPLRKGWRNKLCISHVLKYFCSLSKYVGAPHQMLATVIFGDTLHIPLLHPLGRADLLPRHVLCPLRLLQHFAHSSCKSRPPRGGRLGGRSCPAAPSFEVRMSSKPFSTSADEHNKQNGRRKLLEPGSFDATIIAQYLGVADHLADHYWALLT